MQCKCIKVKSEACFLLLGYPTSSYRTDPSASLFANFSFGLKFPFMAKENSMLKSFYCLLLCINLVLAPKHSVIQGKEHGPWWFRQADWLPFSAQQNYSSISKCRTPRRHLIPICLFTTKDYTTFFFFCTMEKDWLSCKILGNMLVNMPNRPLACHRNYLSCSEKDAQLHVQWVIRLFAEYVRGYIIIKSVDPSQSVSP